MDIKKLYNEWLENAVEDKDLTAELESIKNNEDEIYDRFYTALKFGTAGLRGIIGAGTNRMNIYVVRQATQGLANYVLKKYGKGSVAISHDSRIKADLFMNEAARVLAANGIKVYITSELQPTPVLSYLVRYFKCQAGIMVTASHNPAAYNGYKAYGEDGCQMTDVAANTVYDEISKLDMFKDVKIADFDEAVSNGMIEYVDESVYDTYLEKVMEQQVNPGICEGADLKVVYTPLNGTGNKLVRKVLGKIGVKDVIVVPEQELPDGNFTTCPYPNPEIKEALAKGLELCEKEQPDLLLATDPDADRLGVYAKDSKTGEYVSFTGNMSGMLIAEYILRERTKNGTMPENPALVETIVTTDMAKAIAKAYNVALIEVLTGFKYIGEQIKFFEQSGAHNYVFGLEESYGCLAGTYARDKDACVAVMMLCEVAAYYKQQGKTLWDAMVDMYEEYGYYKEGLATMTLKGIDGAKEIQTMMTNFRENPPKELGGFKVLAVRDYKADVRVDLVSGEKSATGLPSSNVLYYELENNAWCCVRPSGTEPKIKFYFGVKGTSLEDAAKKLEKLKNAMVTA